MSLTYKTICPRVVREKCVYDAESIFEAFKNIVSSNNVLDGHARMCELFAMTCDSVKEVSSVVGTKARNIGSSVYEYGKHLLDMIFDCVTNLCDSSIHLIVNGMKATFSKLIYKFVDFMPDFSGLMSNGPMLTVMILLICASTLAYCLYNPWNAKIITVICAIISAVSLLSANYATSVITGVTAWLAKQLSPNVVYTRVKVDNPVFYAQSFDEKSIDLKRAVKKILTCAGIIGCVSKGQDLGDVDIDAVLKRVDFVGRAAKNGEHLATYFEDAWNEVCAFIMKHIYKTDYVDKSKVAEIDAMYNEVIAMCSMESQLKIGRDPEMTRRIEYLYLRFMRLRTLFADNRQIMSHLNTISIPLLQMYNKVVSKNPEANVMRQEPVCIMIKGSTAIGKSFMTEPLSKHLLKISGKYDAVSRGAGQVYSRCIEQEFWDGYAGQPIVVYDDFGQQKDTINNPNLEFFELIRAVNTFPYNLHSAAMHEKANNPFNAKFIILTTNLPNLKPVSLESQSALVRRVHLCYTLSVIPEVQIGVGTGEFANRVSVTKLNAYRTANNLPSTDMSHYRFVLEDMTTGRVDKPITYNEALIQISNQYKNAYESFKLRTENNLVYDEQPLPEGVFFVSEAIDDEEQRFEGVVERMQGSNMPDIIMEHIRNVESDIFVQRDVQDVSSETFWDQVVSALIKSWKSFRNCMIELFDKIKNMSWFNLISIAISSISVIASFYCFVQYFNVVEDEEDCGYATSEELELWIEEYYAKKSAGEDLPSIFDYLCDKSFAGGLESAELQAVCEKKKQLLESPMVQAVIEKKRLKYESPMVQAVIEKKKVTVESPMVQAVIEKKKPVVESNRYIRRGNFLKENEKAQVESGRALDGSIRKKPQFEGELESVHSQQAYETIDACSRNMILLHVEFHTDEEVRRHYIGQVSILAGHVGLINYHYVNNIKSLIKSTVYNKVYLFWSDPGFTGGHAQVYEEFEATLKTACRDSIETEFAYFKLPKSYPIMKSITKYLMTSRDLNKITRATPLMMCTYVKTAHGFTKTFRSGAFKSYETATFAQPNGPTRTYARVGTSDIDSIHGDCGAPYVAATDFLVNRLMGFHFGGNHNAVGGGTCFAILTQDDVKEVTQNQMIASDVSNVKYISEAGQGMSFPIDGSFRYVGKVQVAVAGACKTKVTPSIIQNKIFETGMAPAALAPALVRDGPMLKALSKNAPSVYPVDKEILRSAVKSYSDMLFSTSVYPADRKVFTYEEACQGIHGDDAVPGLQRGKSAGYPYMQQTNGHVGKTRWLGSDVWDFKSEDSLALRKDVDHIIEEAKNNIVSDVLFVDTLKDEKRPLEKVLAKKTRAFSASPMHYSIAFRRYFGGFLAHMYRNKIKMECCVGVKAHSREWTTLAQYIQSKGKKVVAGDFSNFDGSVNFDIFHETVEIINQWYGDGYENAQIRRCLWENIEHSKHLLYNIVYQMSHGQPSGNPATAVTNSMYNSLASRYVYGLIMKDFGMCDSFNSKVAMVCYGDDNIYNISDDIAHIFHPDAITSGFSAIGMTYTDESKSGDAIFKELNEIGFLKRKFEWCPILKRYMAPLKLESILEMTNWVKPCVSPLEALHVNAKCAIIELYFHDKPVFEEWSSKIRSVLGDEGVAMQVLDWECARNLAAQEDMSLFTDMELAWV